MHVAVSRFSVTDLHETFVKRKAVKAAITVAPLIRVLLHDIGAGANQDFNPIFGTVIGMLFYVVIRDSIPREDRGKPKEHIAGMIIYLAVILTANTI